MVQTLISPAPDSENISPWVQTERPAVVWSEANCLVEEHYAHTGSAAQEGWARAMRGRMGRRMVDPEAEQANLRRRLDNANRYFRRKAAAVFNDETAMHLLNEIHVKVVVETEEFDFCKYGRALAKLTAANFCEIGANSVYITEPGQRFVDNINKE